MIRKLFYYILAPRHPWRRVTFTELSEMYMAGFLKNFAQGLVGVFVPLFLLKSGYSLKDVLMYYSLLYLCSVCFDVVSAYLVARIGPKHVMRLAFLMQFIHAFLLTQIANIPHALIILAVVHSMSACFYWLPYHVDFSKVKHQQHGGKELGWLIFMERVGGIIGPLMGGVIATLFGARALFATSAAVLLIAIIVLMIRPEAVQTRQKLRFQHLLRGHLRNTIANTAFVVENGITILLWPTFLAMLVFSGDAYLKIGSVTSIAVAAAVIAAMPLARLLDKGGGLNMLKVGTVINAVVHLLRIFTPGFGFIGAAGVALVNEPTTLVYRLPYLKAYYDEADDFPGQRIAFIAKNEIIAHFFSGLTFGGLGLIAALGAVQSVFIVGFAFAAICSILIQVQNYTALRRGLLQ